MLKPMLLSALSCMLLINQALAQSPTSNRRSSVMYCRPPVCITPDPSPGIYPMKSLIEYLQETFSIEIHNSKIVRYFLNVRCMPTRNSYYN